MGRKKIRIARIQDDRNRSVTYLKRKAGLMKKAHELAVLTSSEVAVIVFGQNGKLSEFCSTDIDQLLLRYTEHNGPVERKGPDNYQNDDDEGGSDDDNMEDGDDDSGDAGASGPSSAPRRGQHGAGSQGSGHKPSGSNGSSFANAEGGASRASKRKAARDSDVGPGRMSKSREVSPVSGAPIINVEGDSDDDVFADGPGNALAQKVMRKARSNSHHGGRTQVRVPGYKHQHSRSEQNILTSQSFSSFDLTQRPTSADVMRGPNAFVFPPPPASKQASAFFANQDVSPQQSQHFLAPQVWAMPTTRALPVSPQAAGLHPDDAMSYGDLARGGSVSSGAAHSPMSQHLQAPSLTPHSLSPSPLPSPEVQALGHSNAYANAGNLLPLAHPALRDHPQYEAYAERLRQQQQQQRQQQQGNHQRNASMPAFPSAMPYAVNNNLLAAPGASPMNAASPAVSAPPLSPAYSVQSLDPMVSDQRSASFGQGSSGPSNAGRYMHQTSLSDVGPMTSNDFLTPFSAEQRDEVNSAGHYAASRPSSAMSHHSHQSHLSHHSVQPQQSFAGQGDASSSSMSVGSVPPPPYGTNAGLETLQQEQSDAHLSNAAFNDLMGSILSEMSAGQGQGDAQVFDDRSGGNYAASSMSLGNSTSGAPSATPLVVAPGEHDVKAQFFAAGSNSHTATGNYRPFVDGASSGAEF